MDLGCCQRRFLLSPALGTEKQLTLRLTLRRCEENCLWCVPHGSAGIRYYVTGIRCYPALWGLHHVLILSTTRAMTDYRP